MMPMCLQSITLSFADCSGHEHENNEHYIDNFNNNHK